MRYLGVDPGGKRMGFAVGDDSTGVVSPLEIIPYEGTERAAERITAVAARVDASRVVIGLPTLANGSVSPACHRSENLAAALASRGVDVVLQNEYLSTNEARRRAHAAGRPPRQPVDDIAAQIVLEDYLATRETQPAAEA